MDVSRSQSRYQRKSQAEEGLVIHTVLSNVDGGKYVRFSLPWSVCRLCDGAGSAG